MTALLAELEKSRRGAPRRRFASGAAAKLAGIWEAPARGRTGDDAGEGRGAARRSWPPARPTRRPPSKRCARSSIVTRNPGPRCTSTPARRPTCAASSRPTCSTCAWPAFDECARRIARAVAGLSPGQRRGHRERRNRRERARPHRSLRATSSSCARWCGRPRIPRARAAVDRLRSAAWQRCACSTTSAASTKGSRRSSARREVRRTGYAPLLAETLFELGNVCRSSSAPGPGARTSSRRHCGPPSCAATTRSSPWPPRSSSTRWATSWRGSTPRRSGRSSRTRSAPHGWARRSLGLALQQPGRDARASGAAAGGDRGRPPAVAAKEKFGAVPTARSRLIV